MTPHHLHWQKLEERLDLRLDTLVPVRENRLCWIYRGQSRGAPVIIKQYRRDCREGATREGQAVTRYAEACREVSALLPAHVVAQNAQTGTVCLSFIHGELLSRLLRRPLTRSKRQAVLAAVGDLGKLLARMRELTLSSRAISTFLEEYLIHTSHKLATLPLFGPVLFGDHANDSGRLFEQLSLVGEPSSLSHGDLVFANMIFDGRRVGLIDFANANFESHTLDDLYAFQITCDNLLHLSSSLRLELVNALKAGLGRTSFDPRVHHFFWEYHRRRWLSINARGTLIRRVRFLLALPRMARSVPVAESLALA